MIDAPGRIGGSPAALDPRRSWPAYVLATGVVLAAFLVFLDPAPSRGLAPVPRAAFWLLHVLGPLALAQGATIALAPGAIVAEAAALAGPVTLAWTAINGSRFLQLGERAPGPAAPAEAGAPAFLARLRPGLGTQVVALSAELHYLRVHTALGHDLILYPFGRAVAEMPESAGLRLHRSHWVARGRLARIERAGSGGRAVTDTGLKLPVARTRMAAVRAAL